MARRHAGTFSWWGSAAVLRSGIAAPVIPMRLNARGPELWSHETRLGLRYRPIGACTIKIPDNCRRDEYSVRIQGGYTYNGVPPAPPSARLDVPVPIPQSEAV